MQYIFTSIIKFTNEFWSTGLSVINVTDLIATIVSITFWHYYVYNYVVQSVEEKVLECFEL